jgi:hypothetical protein
MANIGPEMHRFGVNIKLHLLQPGESFPHGPRVKFFKEDPNVSFSVSLSHDPTKIKLVSGHRPTVSQSDLNKLIAGVIKYCEPFLKFWNSPGMTVGELRDLMDKVDMKGDS